MFQRVHQKKEFSRNLKMMTYSIILSKPYLLFCVPPNWSHNRIWPQPFFLWFEANPPEVLSKQIQNKLCSTNLWRMERIVEDVKDEGETKGNPTNSQGCKDFVCWDIMRSSRSVKYSDALAGCGQYQGHYCQAEKKLSI